MATITAQILTGRAHPCHGGIGPSHYLFLSENDRCDWQLVPQNIARFDRDRREQRPLRWITRPDDILEDALLLIGLHVARAPDLIELATSSNPDALSDRLESRRDFPDARRKELNRLCRRLVRYPKLIVTVLEGSTLRAQLPLLEYYNMDVEVCSPVYHRLRGSGGGPPDISGSLDLPRRP